MMSERDCFLKALQEDEEDTETRLVYADWLDDHGQHEEADRQRKIPEAIKWLKRFAEQWNFFSAREAYPGGHSEYVNGKYIWVKDDTEINVNAWKEMVEEALNSDGYLVARGTDLHGSSDLDPGDEREFWEYVQIYSGKEIDTGHRDSFTWGCSC